ncbi:MAG: DUF3565 domain-containing protein [Thiotrichales bacterium]|nr:DUF3565 domain-containing protein [Thiotrichales bacterium]
MKEATPFAGEPKRTGWPQPMVGYHVDEAGDWVAELACGHCQHIRHQPPWINRPWVTTQQGREAMLGQTLVCRKCELGAPRDWCLPTEDPIIER